MSNADRLMEILEALAPKGLCDDHLALEANIQPRQQVNQLSRRLAEEGLILRAKGNCAHGDVGKLVNSIRESTLATPGLITTPLGAPREGQGPSVLEAWRRIDRFCRAIWPRRVGRNPPLALNDIISGLRDEGVVPQHSAIMMNPLRIMRNEVGHMDAPIGPREQAISTAAYYIVAEWAATDEAELWRVTGRRT